ncbi:MAG: recombinase family protein [Solobacterium sp.]|nr:recombinase family protein [Solobacterium sp.]
MVQITRIPGFRSLRKMQVAAYIRVSTAEGRQEESYGNQKTYYERKITSNPEWELAGIYGDEMSGTHLENREEFQKLIRDAMDGKIDLILCKSVSRWARNILDGLNTLRLLNGNGVHVIFEEQGIDTRNAGVILQLNLAQAIAQSESESISENMKWTFRNKAAQGRYYGRRGMFFGYDCRGDEFSANADSRHVRYMFEMYAEGAEIKEITADLNRRGVKNKRGKEWKEQTVRDILQNEIYVGDVIFNKTPSRNVITREIDKNWQPRYVRDHHTGIVSRELWNAVQERINRTKRKRNPRRPGKYTDSS